MGENRRNSDPVEYARKHVIAIYMKRAVLLAFRLCCVIRDVVISVVFLSRLMPGLMSWAGC